MRPRIQLKTRGEIEQMRIAGRIVHQVLQMCRSMAKPGVRLIDIDNAADQLIRASGGEGLFKGYPGPVPFPSHLCMSMNEVVVHGIASERELKDGDILGVDCGVRINGWCGDSATTIEVGEVDAKTKDLIGNTRACLQIAIDEIKPGKRWSEVARKMQRHAESAGYGVVRQFVGHGIGRELHEIPQIPNYVSRELLRNDILLKEGMVLAIEPMVNMGTHEVVTLPDGWTVVTKDGLPAVHEEHTIAITAKGADVLTDGR